MRCPSRAPFLFSKHTNLCTSLMLALAPWANACSDDAQPAGDDACTAAELTQAIDDYLTALAAQDPAQLRVAADVRFTENGKPLALGEGLWKAAGEVKFQRVVVDAESCGAVAQVVIMERETPAVLGLRLKLTGARISEVETIVAGKEQDEDPDARVPLFPDVIIDTPQPEWDEVLSPALRSSRSELNHIADVYFDGFVTAGTSNFEPIPFTDDCAHWGNGLAGGSCNAVFEGRMGTPSAAITHRRYPVTDVERGITVVFANVRNFWIDLHMFKVRGGKVQRVQTVLSSFASEDTTTGW
jgi:hypothetical protein